MVIVAGRIANVSRGAIRCLRSGPVLPLSSRSKAAEIAEGVQTSLAGLPLINAVDLWDEVLLLEGGRPYLVLSNAGSLRGSGVRS